MIQIVAVGAVVAVKFQVVIKVTFELVQFVLIILTSNLDPSIGLVGFDIEHAEVIDEFANELGFYLLKKRDFIVL